MRCREPIRHLAAPLAEPTWAASCQGTPISRAQRIDISGRFPNHHHVPACGQEFFDRLTTLGFNMDGDDKIVLDPSQLPVKPEGCEDQVVWKYGVDSDPAAKAD